MDYLRAGIHLRAMANRDPVIEYQREGFDMFSAMLDGIKEESVGFLFNLEVKTQDEQEAEAIAAQQAAEAEALARAQEGTARVLARQAEQQTAPATSAGNGGGAGTATARRSGKHRPAAEDASAEPAGDGSNLGIKGLGPSRQAANLQYSAPSLDASPKESGAAKAAKTATVTGTKEPGRNAPCPCGSGKKYKVCHGRPGQSL
jgi:preprotein translocase subunit SecA